jgi:putative lipoprotein (rSAM/lipoprotein system)
LLLAFSGIVYRCAEYGAIVPECEINGIVTDKNKKPIQNIRVTRENHLGIDTLYTNSAGMFHSINQGATHIKLEDIDGEANGGEFETQEIDVKFTDADLVKRGKNNKTPDKYAKTINIELETKQ